MRVCCLFLLRLYAELPMVMLWLVKYIYKSSYTYIQPHYPSLDPCFVCTQTHTHAVKSIDVQFSLCTSRINEIKSTLFAIKCLPHISKSIETNKFIFTIHLLQLEYATFSQMIYFTIKIHQTSHCCRRRTITFNLLICIQSYNHNNRTNRTHLYYSIRSEAFPCSTFDSNTHINTTHTLNTENVSS